MATAEEEQAKLDAEDGKGPDGQSIEDLANAQVPEELFTMENGKRVSIGNLIARKTPVEYSIKLGSKRVQGGDDMGLLGFGTGELTLIVPGLPGKVTIDPTYNADGTIKKVAVVQEFKPKMFYDLDTPKGRAAVGLE